MSLFDFFLMNAQPLLSLIIALAVVGVIAWQLLKHVDDPEARKYIRVIRNIVLLIAVVAFTISMIKRAAVQLPRTTIDRSVGDEQYEKLKQTVEEGEVR